MEMYDLEDSEHVFATFDKYSRIVYRLGERSRFIRKRVVCRFHGWSRSAFDRVVGRLVTSWHFYRSGGIFGRVVSRRVAAVDDNEVCDSHVRK